MEKNKSNNLAVCIICGVLTAFGMVLNIISMCSGRNEIMIRDASDLIMLVLIGYYAFYGYRRPHGNLLKYIILLYAASFLVKIASLDPAAGTLASVLDACTIGICCYIAGRLHRVKQNTVLMCITAVIIVIKIINRFMVADATIGIFANLIIWIDICVAYVLRYKEHKLAGLMDKTEK